MSWFKNLGITTKLLAGFLLTVGITIVVGVKAIYDLNQMAGHGQMMYEKMTVPIGALGKAVESYQLLRGNLRNLLLTTGAAENQKYLNLLQQNKTDFGKDLDSVRDSVVTPKAKAALVNVDTVWMEFRPAFEKIVSLGMQDKNAEAWAAMNDPSYLQQAKAVDDSVAVLVAAEVEARWTSTTRTSATASVRSSSQLSQ